MSDDTPTTVDAGNIREHPEEPSERGGVMDESSTYSVDVSADTWEQLRELREQGESIDETIERLLENAQDKRLLFSKFSVFVMIGTLMWLGSFIMVGETVSNAVAGFIIVLTLFWLIYQELAFRGIFGPNAD